jgi:hypothetical protein
MRQLRFAAALPCCAISTAVLAAASASDTPAAKAKSIVTVVYGVDDRAESAR